MLKICVFNISKYYTSFPGVKIKFISYPRTMQLKMFKIEVIYSTIRDKTALTVTHVIKVLPFPYPSNNRFSIPFVLPPNPSPALQPVFMILDFLPSCYCCFLFFSFFRLYFILFYLFNCIGSSFACVSFLCLHCVSL